MNVRIERRAILGTAEGRLERMVEIRRVEERIQSLYSEGHVRGSTHLANGQEAVAVGIASVLRPSDTVTCTYRGHANALALGLTPEEVLGEICGRQIGCGGGIGGSMHLLGPDVGLMPTFAIVGAGVPIAAGAALTAQTTGTDAMALTVFGDGACNIGAVHETMNLASVWRLPMVFVIENNLYGEYSPIARTTPIVDLAHRADAYAIPWAIVDGQDVDAVMQALTSAVDRARSDGGPTVLEMKTYRYSGHSRSDAASYRPKGELEMWQRRDPIAIASNALPNVDLRALEAAVDRRVASAVEIALASPSPEIKALLEHVTAESPWSDHLKGVSAP